MNIELSIEDFGMLWHTACDTNGLEINEDHGFEWVKGDTLERFDSSKTNYVYWVGDNAIQALAALQLVKYSCYYAGLFWDSSPFNENENSDAWGFCIVTNKAY